MIDNSLPSCYKCTSVYLINLFMTELASFREGKKESVYIPPVNNNIESAINGIMALTEAVKRILDEASNCSDKLN